MDREAYLNSIAAEIVSELRARGLEAAVCDMRIEGEADDDPFPADATHPPMVEVKCADGEELLWGLKDDRDDIPDGAWYPQTWRVREPGDYPTTLVVGPPPPESPAEIAEGIAAEMERYAELLRRQAELRWSRGVALSRH